MKRSPRIEPGSPRRGAINTKIKPGLRAALEEAAAANGRTLSNEIEMRLLASFAAEKPSLTAGDVRQIVREEMVKPCGCHPHSATIAKAEAPSAGEPRYVGYGPWLRPDGSPVFPEDA